MSFEKLRKRPVDDETAILKSQEEMMGGKHVLIEFWIWSGVSACSAIFLKEEVEGMSHTEIKKFYFDNIEIEPEGNETFGEKEGFVFLNYNFRSIDE